MIDNEHGGDIYSKEILLDFSASINPLGMPCSAKRALAENIKAFECYPDINCTELRLALQEYEGVPMRNIVCKNGAAELIYCIAAVIKPKKALIIAPTFSEYEKAVRSVGCEIEYYYLDEKSDFSLDEGILNRLDGVDIVFICNPNNPTAKVSNGALIEKIAQECLAASVYLVIDECFMDFVENSHLYRAKAELDNVIILKAFTKIYAMAGLRLGYLISRNEGIVSRISQSGQCWSVSVPAQIAGVASLGEKDFIQKTVQLISDERKYLSREFTRLGFKVYSSSANFIMFYCDLPLDSLLLDYKIAIRSLAGFNGLSKGFYRAACRGHDENVKLISAIERILKRWQRQ